MIATMLAAAVALIPVQPWKINYADSQCQLSRAYGSADKPVVLILSDILGGTASVTLNLLVPAPTNQAREDGSATLSMEPSHVAQQHTFFSTVLRNNGGRLLQTTLNVAPDVDLQAVSTLNVKAASVDVTLEPGFTQAAMKAFAACTEKLRARLGMSSDESALIGEPPLGPASPEDWVSSADYPKDALRERKQGSVVALLTIGADGRVSRCDPVVSSGTPALDAATCTLVTRRGRFKPAIAKDGRFTPSHYVWQTDWQLPPQ